MKKYMVIINDGEGTWTYFTDDLNRAEEVRMDAAVSMGHEAEVYERAEIDEGLIAYQLLYN